MVRPGSNLGRVGVVGGGVAGLTAARVLAEAGADVTVFDKGRKPGGRVSTKRADSHTYDHGAQFFTARDPEFERVVRRWVEQGVVAPWRARVVVLGGGSVAADPGHGERFVGTPTMSSVGAALTREARSAGAAVEASVRIGEIAHSPGGAFVLTDVDGEVRGRFDRVVVNTPAGQAVPLLASSPSLARAAGRVVMHPCLAGMVSFDAPLDADFDAAFVDDSPIAWMARDSSKPGRAAGEHWVLHAAPAWSSARFEDDLDDVTGELLDALASLVGPLPDVTHRIAFRWRYALCDAAPSPEPYLLDAERGIGACGDWCVGGRVEGAFRSGLGLARRLLDAVPEGSES